MPPVQSPEHSDPLVLAEFMRRLALTSKPVVDEGVAHDHATCDHDHTPKKVSKGRKSDVLINAFPKCGTTWMQQAMHQLRTGDESFGNISLVVPPKQGQKAHQGCTCNGHSCTKAGDGFTPRIYKTHAAGHDAREMADRHVVVLRDPRDALWSLYNFKPNVFAIDKNSISVRDFYHSMFKCLQPDNYWEFTESWWHERANAQVLFVFYEDMKSDMPRVLRRLAAFLDIPLTPSLESIVLHHSSFEYMRENKHMFDDQVGIDYLRNLIGLSDEEVASPIVGMVNAQGGGETTTEKRLPQDVLDDMAMRWRETVEKTTGVKSYEDMKTLLSR